MKVDEDELTDMMARKRTRTMRKYSLVPGWRVSRRGRLKEGTTQTQTAFE